MPTPWPRASLLGVPHDRPSLHFVDTEMLRIAYVEHGPCDGWPVILSHGFPYDVHAFDEVAPILASAGARVILPYTRGFGPTDFLPSCAA